MTARALLVCMGAASVLGVGVAAAGGAAGGAAACDGTPRLALAGAHPVKLVGSGFCAGERLRVRARAGEARRTRRVRADDSGAFRLRFGQLRFDPCTSDFRAFAHNSGDLRASLKHAQKLCPVP
jgi:hypothetical protein